MCLEFVNELLLFERKYKSNKLSGSFLSCFHQFYTEYKTMIISVFINMLLLVRCKSSKLFQRPRNDKSLRITTYLVHSVVSSPLF